MDLGPVQARSRSLLREATMRPTPSVVWITRSHRYIGVSKEVWSDFWSSRRY